MDYKHNIKYFQKSKLSYFIISALAIFAIAFVLFLIIGREIQTVFIIATGVAIVLLIVGFSIEPKDEILDDCAIPIEREFREDFHAKFLEKPIDKLKMLSAEYRRRAEPEYWGVYYMEDDDVSGRHGRDGTFRSSEYCQAGLWLEKDRLSIGIRIVSLVEEKHVDDMREFDFKDLAPIEYVSPKYPDMARYRVIAIHKEGSDDVMRVPVHDDAHIEDIVEGINIAIERIRAGQEENN